VEAVLTTRDMAATTLSGHHLGAEIEAKRDIGVEATSILCPAFSRAGNVILFATVAMSEMFGQLGNGKSVFPAELIHELPIRLRGPVGETDGRPGPMASFR
jgi:hypothetical protein